MTKSLAKKEETSVATATANALTPDWVTEDYGVQGTEQVKQRTVSDLIKIVQQMSQTLKDVGHDECSVVLVPSGIVVAELDDTFDKPHATRRSKPFHIRMIGFYPEVIRWLDRDEKNKAVGPLIDRTTNESSDLYRTGLNRETWKQTVAIEGTDFMVVNSEHLNFYCEIISGPATGQLASFSLARTGHKEGQTLNTLIASRRGPVYGGQYEVVARGGEKRSNVQGFWYGFDFTNPSEASGIGPWPEKEEMGRYKAMYEAFAKLLASSTFEVDVQSGVDTGSPEESGEDF